MDSLSTARLGAVGAHVGLLLLFGFLLGGIVLVVALCLFIHRSPELLDTICLSMFRILPSSLFLFLVIALAFVSVHTQDAAQVFFPAIIPLAVSSPYLSVWMVSTNGSVPLPQSVPNFWTLSVCAVLLLSKRSGTYV